MRTIKFRALKDDMSDFRFVYGNLIYDHKDNPRIQEDRNEPTFTTCIKGTECQFTGLHDKYGKEVFDGDVLLHDSEGEFTIIWDNDFLGFAAKSEGSNAVDSIHAPYLRQCKIIGNVFKNPDLVKL